VIRDLGVGVAVPLPNSAVFVASQAAEDSNEGAQEFGVRTNSDWSIDLIGVGGDAQQSPGSCTSCPAPCTDTATSLGGWDESDEHQWWFDVDTAPVSQPSGQPQITSSETVAALRAGTTDITHTYNDCGMADTVRGTTAKYLGDRDVSAGVYDGTNDCYAQDDNNNAVDFGDLKSGTVALHCKWVFFLSGTDELMHGDIRFNKADYNFTVRPSASVCSGDYDIDSVMAHERGHTYGLTHVSETTHGNLTMSEKSPSCSSNPRTLGKGDVNGLKAIYGTTGTGCCSARRHEHSGQVSLVPRGSHPVCLGIRGLRRRRGFGVFGRQLCCKREVAGR
jgi:matrixin